MDYVCQACKDLPRDELFKTHTICAECDVVKSYPEYYCVHLLRGNGNGG